VAEAAPEFPADRPDAYEIVRDAEALQPLDRAARRARRVAVDTETTSLDEMTAELVGVSLSVEPGEACYIPLGHVAGGGDLSPRARRAGRGADALEEALAR
jgi:DNA polymerase-1